MTVDDAKPSPWRKRIHDRGRCEAITVDDAIPSSRATMRFHHLDRRCDSIISNDSCDSVISNDSCDSVISSRNASPPSRTIMRGHYLKR
ncbi:hypothetical protein AVEN_39055-1 [Araneus ventricosus]|uniref:Uncharacterized protein n=1 Tax=Araneus ventricosus TaxID=182803 RepID=A0A4Y2KZM2_ARAVE|nr:hypothetical protein AVEN_39055-1 [Araneus ventricosus]